jgi:hypothetical protein
MQRRDSTVLRGHRAAAPSVLDLKTGNGKNVVHCFQTFRFWHLLIIYISLSVASQEIQSKNPIKKSCSPKQTRLVKGSARFPCWRRQGAGSRFPAQRSFASPKPSCHKGALQRLPSVATLPSAKKSTRKPGSFKML